MARNSNILTGGLRGAIGNSVVFKELNGETIATKYPDRSQVKYTAKQIAYQELFKQAVAYACAIRHDPEKYEAYQSKIRNGSKSGRRSTVYQYAIREFMKEHSTKVPVDAVTSTIEKYVAAFQPDDWEMLVLKYLAAQREISNADYRRLAKVSKPTATRHLRSMVEKGLISGSSRGAGAVYVLMPLETKQ